MTIEEYVVQELQETKKKLEDVQKTEQSWMDECMKRREEKENLIDELKIFFKEYYFENNSKPIINELNFGIKGIKISKINTPLLYELLKIINSNVQSEEDFNKLKDGDIITFDEINSDYKIINHYEKKKIWAKYDESIKLESNIWIKIFKNNIINLKIEEEKENDLNRIEKETK